MIPQKHLCENLKSRNIVFVLLTHMCSLIIIKSPDSSVSVVTRLWAERFLLLTTNNSRENTYCDASGNIFNSTDNLLVKCPWLLCCYNFYFLLYTVIILNQIWGTWVIGVVRNTGNIFCELCVHLMPLIFTNVIRLLLHLTIYDMNHIKTHTIWLVDN